MGTLSLKLEVPYFLLTNQRQRPSQGLMTLEGGIPLSYTEDTAGGKSSSPLGLASVY